MSAVHGRTRRSHRKTGGTTHKGKHGVHGATRRGSPIAYEAKRDAWKRVGQAKRQG